MPEIPEITVELVEKLVNDQFPEWKNLRIKPIEHGGWDNRTFHLGDKMLVRLPSAEQYASQPEKEFEWLPKLSNYISLPIPLPIAKGAPTSEYPFSWTINPLLPGKPVSRERISDMKRFVFDLAKVLGEIHAADTENAPAAGRHNFYRGGDLSVYDGETRNAIEQLKSRLPADRLTTIWNLAVRSQWKQKPVWVHGDVAVGNLLANNGALCAVIDFGSSAVGDPACDYVMAWTFFDAEHRALFFELLGCDKDTIDRARGWALWKAIIYYDDMLSKHTVDAILNER